MAFGAATRSPLPEAEPETKPEPAVKEIPAHFFAKGGDIPLTLHAKVPLEVLLFQIENHIRLEQAVAESFVDFPTAELLHSRTVSQLIQ